MKLPYRQDCLLRRSAAATVQWNHITSADDGTGRLLVMMSETNQEGESTILLIPGQAIRDLSAIRPEGAGGRLIFGLNPRSMRKRLTAAARAVAAAGAISGHSARVGLVRELSRAGEELGALMIAGRWKGPEMVTRCIAIERADRGAAGRFN